jgi:hypothetical protein
MVRFTCGLEAPIVYHDESPCHPPTTPTAMPAAIRVSTDDGTQVWHLDPTDPVVVTLREIMAKLPCLPTLRGKIFVYFVKQEKFCYVNLETGLDE